MSDPSPKSASEYRRPPSLLVRIWPIYVLAVVLVIALQTGLSDYLTIDKLREYQDVLKRYVDAHPFSTFFLFVALYAVATAFMLTGAWITIAGGLLFGMIFGTLGTTIGATLGASLLFWVAQTSIGSALRERAGPFLSKMEKGFQEDAFFYMLATRLIPAVPFAVANIAPALLGAKFREFVLVTAIGIIPGVVLYTSIGTGLGASLDIESTGDPLEIAKNFIPAFVALGIVALLPVVYRRFVAKRNMKSNLDENE